MEVSGPSTSVVTNKHVMENLIRNEPQNWPKAKMCRSVEKSKFNGRDGPTHVFFCCVIFQCLKTFEVPTLVGASAIQRFNKFAIDATTVLDQVIFPAGQNPQGINFTKTTTTEEGLKTNS